MLKSLYSKKQSRFLCPSIPTMLKYLKLRNRFSRSFSSIERVIQEQANSALHEAIGDTIMLGATTPQHLHRLRLINDTELFEDDHERVALKGFKREHLGSDRETNIEFIGGYSDGNTKKTDNTKGDLGNENDKENEVNSKMNLKGFNVKNVISTSDVLMLKQVLNKLPQIPFSLVLDEYRWRMFEGNLDMGYMNKEFWALVKELQGIAPVGRREEVYFDIGAKYHVADNVPYVRYFLSSFIQHQLFEKLCKVAVFGRKEVSEPMPSSITLHRCDIYGSKAVGKILKDVMSRGSSQHWLVSLQEAADIDSLSPSALINYYRPAYNALAKIVQQYDIPIGW